MAELTLPKNSTMSEGKTWPRPEGANNLREFRIYRWNPDDDANPTIDTYYVDMDDCGPMVLDGLLYIKNSPPAINIRSRTETSLNSFHARIFKIGSSISSES